jgi:hypothetical protein
MRDLAKRASTPERRRELRKLARVDLKLAQAQMRDPSHRPDMRLRMSADQYRAIGECLSGLPEAAHRTSYFAGMAETAGRADWPSSAIAPYLVLMAEELELISSAPYWTRQRLFAPLLTASEQAALHKAGEADMEYFKLTFAPERSMPGQGTGS